MKAAKTVFIMALVSLPADIILLDRNLFDIPVAKISDTEVEMTLFEDNIVYQRVTNNEYPKKFNH